MEVDGYMDTLYGDRAHYRCVAPYGYQKFTQDYCGITLDSSTAAPSVTLRLSNK
jgi:hypothetical protein